MWAGLTPIAIAVINFSRYLSGTRGKDPAGVIPRGLFSLLW